MYQHYYFTVSKLRTFSIELPMQPAQVFYQFLHNNNNHKYLLSSLSFRPRNGEILISLFGMKHSKHCLFSRELVSIIKLILRKIHNCMHFICSYFTIHILCSRCCTLLLFLQENIIKTRWPKILQRYWMAATRIC